MNKLNLIPVVAVAALFASAGTATASPSITKGHLAPEHRATPVATATQGKTCNVLNRACASPASMRTQPSSAAQAVASQTGTITMGRFQPAFIDNELAVADAPDSPNAPGEPEVL